MSDEKTTIYISPEDDLTSLRERLEKIQARSITLVIPTQSQLRSHVAWKLLRARSRELGKDILVVSTDPQIRSVAQSVKFKVATSLESPSSGRSRPPTRSSRSILGNRSRPTGSTQRPAKSAGQNTGSIRPQRSEPTPQWSPSTDRSIRPLANSPSDEDVVTGNISDIDPSLFADDRYDVPGEQVPYNFQMHQSPPIHPLSQEPIDEEADMWEDDFNQAQHIREAASQAGREESDPGSEPVEHNANARYGEMTTPTHTPPSEESGYSYRMTPLPGVGEDPLASMDDVSYPPIAEQRGSVPAIEGFGTSEHRIQDVPPHPDLHEDQHTIEYDGDQDDFSLYSDVPHAPQPLSEPVEEDEQDRAGPPPLYRMRPRSSRSGRHPANPPASPQYPAVPGQEYDNDDALSPFADRPTQIQPQVPPATPAASGTFTTPRISRNLQPGTRASGNLPPNQGQRLSGAMSPNQAPRQSGQIAPGPATRASGTLSQRPATRASGNLPPNQGQRLSGQMPPNQVPRQSGQIAPGPATRASGNLPPGAATRASGNLPPGQSPQGSRNVQARPTPASQSGNISSRNRPALSRPVPRQARTGRVASRSGPVSRASASAARRRRSLGLLAVAALVLVVLVLALMDYLLPSANVTVTLAAQNYSTPVRLLASPTNASNAATGTIPDQTVRKDFTINGNGKATGTTKVGTAPAKGLVFFTNNGSRQVIIPSNVIVTTGNGTQFVTQAEVSVGPKGGSLNRLPTTIQAQNSGDTGNVPAGSITSIPASSLSSIAQYNNTQAADLNLKVTNDAATTGGGAGTATSVTQNDLNDTQKALSAQLQNEVTTWVQQQLAPGDVAGKPVTTPTLTKAPKANDIEPGGTFPASLTQNVAVPIVRASTLRSATVAQLNTALNKDTRYQNYQILPDSANALQIPQFAPTSNGLSMTLNFKPTGKIVRKLPDIRSRLVGKTRSEATSVLQSLVPGMQKMDLQVSPSFYPWTPLRSTQINVKYVAGSSSPGNVKAGG